LKFNQLGAQVSVCAWFMGRLFYANETSDENEPETDETCVIASVIYTLISHFGRVALLDLFVLYGIYSRSFYSTIKKKIFYLILNGGK